MAALNNNAPAYFLDRPYNLSDHSLLYGREELEGLVNFLEDLSGRKMDYHRVGEAIKSSHQAIKILKDQQSTIIKIFGSQGNRFYSAIYFSS